MTSTILSPIYPPFLPDSYVYIRAFLFAYLEGGNDIALKEKARAKYI